MLNLIDSGLIQPVRDQVSSFGSDGFLAYRNRKHPSKIIKRCRKDAEKMRKVGYRRQSMIEGVCYI